DHRPDRQDGLPGATREVGAAGTCEVVRGRPDRLRSRSREALLPFLVVRAGGQVNGSSYRTGLERNPPPYWHVPEVPKAIVNVTAALCWWNEKPEDLARCVRGVANIADRIVALDGAYVRYPGATVRSDEKQ